MIKHDKSCLSGLDLLAIEKGYAELDLHSLRISREDYTEEQKAENKRIANSVSREEWSKRCELVRQETANRIKPLLDSLDEKFSFYQYNEQDREKIPYGSDWDLFFWCNGDSKGRDYSYATLSFNDKRSIEQKYQDLEKVLEYAKEIGFEGMDITIQYKIKYNDKMVINAAIEYAESMQNKFIEYKGYTGKIKEVGKYHLDNTVYGFYGFFKKGSKKNYFKLDYLELLRMTFQ